MKLVIIHHDSFSPDQIPHYFISGLIPHWEKLGIEVQTVSGTRNLPEADAAFLHVDLSVIPRRFTEAVRRYPVVINSRLLDIRKRTLPDTGHHVLSPGDFKGPVLIKTNMNHKAEPERRAFRRAAQNHLPLPERWNLWKIGRQPKSELAYELFSSTDLVPGKIWKNRDYVVEKFQPEREGNHYVLRNAYFLNETRECWKLVAPNPVVRWRELVHEELCPLPPEVEAYSKRIGMDYGKIDFVMHGDKPFIFDVNKTIGGPALPEEEISFRMAQGLKSLLKL